MPFRRALQRLALGLFVLVEVGGTPARGGDGVAAVSAPVLKWQRGGCLASFCQTGWYASPAVADLDGDGTNEVIWASYDLVSLDGATGAEEWRASSPNRSWPGIAVADLTGDGSLEVVVGRSSNELVVHNGAGGVIWTRTAFPGQSGEVRTLAVADLDGNGSLEIVVGRASPGDTRQLNVFDAAGNVRPGWPARRDGEPGYGWGMYNENVTVADLDGDGFKEIIGPTDTHYITALDRDGNQLLANAVYGTSSAGGNKRWSEVGVHVDHAVDLRGYADCGVEHRPNFANSAPAIADVDGDGTLEIVVVGDVYDCSIGDPDGDLYHLPWILKRDRPRWSGSGFDWTVIPTAPAGSGPLAQGNYALIEDNVQNTVVADLDGDGRKEILFPSYDGRIHAYWLDKTQHGNWPYKVPGTGIRFAGEPVVVDLDADGKAEVIFTSWPEKGGGQVGQLHVLDNLGNPLHVLNLPAPFGGATWNGGLGAPTVANIDSDPDFELVVGTTSTGVVAYDLPGSAAARVLWGTGRGTQRRAGVPPAALPQLRIDDRIVAEGAAQNASFRVTLTPASATSVTVSYATESGTATAGNDFTATSGTLTLTPGRISHAVFVPILVDGASEGTEAFTMRLSNAVGAVILDDAGAGTITDPPAAADVPMYRAYNPNAFYHFFTTSLGEFTNAVAAGYRDESNPPCCSIPFRVPNLQGTGKAAIFRMYNPNNGRHYYTASGGERDVLMGLGWVYEKDEGFVYPASGTPGTVEVFKLYNNISGVHLYTVRPEEKDAILAQFPGIWFQHTSLGFAVP